MRKISQISKLAGRYPSVCCFIVF